MTTVRFGAAQIQLNLQLLPGAFRYAGFEEPRLYGPAPGMAANAGLALVAARTQRWPLTPFGLCCAGLYAASLGTPVWIASVGDEDKTSFLYAEMVFY